MQYNEFNRRLEHCHLDKETKIILSHMFEVQMEFSKYLDKVTDLMEKLTERMQSVTNINSGMIVALKELQQRGMMDGVSVRSEPGDS